MPISEIGTSTDAPRPRADRRAGGFSLLELLVVVVIIGIFVGAAVLSIGITGTDRAGERQAARLKGVLDLVREEALMQNRDFGVVFTRTAYRFYSYDYGVQSWVEPADDRLLAEHILADGLGLALVVEDREIALEDELDATQLEDPQPQVMILSSGEMTPFEASISRDVLAGEHVLTVTVDGATEITSRDYAAP